eukprot:gnl/Spiro4/7156_TR3729_c0_g1_i1.p1 gnl/Spiro4/7156_TR3729_c0_g1~~gnl/Spiro4/7156_TR3729_c0_g1_i1.p1  ORF type:complete len:197 (-),score=58.84 gnl/Spiro4/7156_TR3729_c0_g1_i1:180-701(-)
MALRGDVMKAKASSLYKLPSYSNVLSQISRLKPGLVLMEGTVLEAVKNAFRIDLNKKLAREFLELQPAAAASYTQSLAYVLNKSKSTIIGTLSGVVRRNRIRILSGDTVQLEIAVDSPTTARIVDKLQDIEFDDNINDDEPTPSSHTAAEADWDGESYEEDEGEEEENAENEQ